MKYIKIQPNQLSQVWEQVEPLIKKSINAGFDDSNPIHVYRGIMKGIFHLYVMLDEDKILMALVVSIVEKSNQTALHVNHLAGVGNHNLPEAMRDAWPTILKWAKGMGATVVEAHCHPVMFRMLQKYNFTSKQVVATLDI